MSGDTEAERDEEGSETDLKTVRGRCRRGRQTCPHAHTYMHTHTERHRWRDRDTEQLTESQKTVYRHGREDGIRSETDTLAHILTHLRGHAEEALLQGRVSALGQAPAGLAVTRGVPKTFSQWMSQRVPFSFAT